MIEYKVKVYNDGVKEWYLNGERHREDGPAVDFANGYKTWWINGQRHREDGPAIEYANGIKKWYLKNEQLTEEEFLQRTRIHTIIIDNKEIKISEESFQNLKQSLK